MDLRARGDLGFWLHLFGLLAFWGGVTALGSESETARFIYCLINIGLIGLGLFLQRRVYAVFGGLGIALYLHHLAERVFADTLLYPLALSLIGLAVIGARSCCTATPQRSNGHCRTGCRAGSPCSARLMRDRPARRRSAPVIYPANWLAEFAAGSERDESDRCTSGAVRRERLLRGRVAPPGRGFWWSDRASGS